MLDLWYKNAVIYCLDVETFVDANGDGVGDFQGLTDRLDHIEALGATCVWLLPFYPSPNRDNDACCFGRQHLAFAPADLLALSYHWRGQTVVTAHNLADKPAEVRFVAKDIPPELTPLFCFDDERRRCRAEEPVALDGYGFRGNGERR